jgi:DNA-binding HxlR family transcriptional regulator
MIEYQLAPDSHTFEKVVSALTEWGIQHREEIQSEWSRIVLLSLNLKLKGHKKRLKRT